MLHVGATVIAKGAICAINELLRLPFEDQANLLSVLSEGQFPFNKLSIMAQIYAQSVIIASANPSNKALHSNKTEGKIDMDLDIPGIKPLLDRFPYKYYITKEFDRTKNIAFAYKKFSLYETYESGAEPMDYVPILVKYVLYAKTFKPKMSDDAKSILSKAFADSQEQTNGSPRIFEVLYNMAITLAQAKFKNEVEDVDALEIIADYKKMLSAFDNQSINDAEEPLELSYRVARDVIKNSIDPTNRTKHIPIERPDMVKTISAQNQQIDYYLQNGKPLRLNANKSLKKLHDRLANDSHIAFLGISKYLWIDETSNEKVDDSNNNNNNNNNNSENVSDIKINKEIKDDSSIQNNQKTRCDQSDRCDRTFEKTFEKYPQGSMTNVYNIYSFDEGNHNENIEESNRTLAKNLKVFKNTSVTGHNGHTSDSLTNDNKNDIEQDNIKSDFKQPIRYGNSEEPQDLEELKAQAAEVEYDPDAVLEEATYIETETQETKVIVDDNTPKAQSLKDYQDDSSTTATTNNVTNNGTN